MIRKCLECKSLLQQASPAGEDASWSAKPTQSTRGLHICGLAGIWDHLVPSSLKKDQLPTCPGGLVGDHKGTTLSMALTDIYSLSQVEHRQEAAAMVVGWPAAIVLLGDGSLWNALVL